MEFKSKGVSFKTRDVQEHLQGAPWKVRAWLQVGEWVFRLALVGGILAVPAWLVRHWHA